MLPIVRILIFHYVILRIFISVLLSSHPVLIAWKTIQHITKQCFLQHVQAIRHGETIILKPGAL